MSRSQRVGFGLLGLWAVGAMLSPATAEEWTRFRGPNGSGVSPGPAAPVEFGPESRVAWVTDVPFARSSPVVAGNRVVITTAGEESFSTLAFDRATGKLLWESSVERRRRADMYHDQDAATPSPVSDGENVYVFFQENGLVSYDSAGRQRWHLDLGPFRNFYGMVASPVLAGDRLFLVCDQVVGSFLLAVDKDSGEILWRRERTGRLESYTTPILDSRPGAKPALLVFGSGHLDAYALDSGELLWSQSGLPAGPVASPVLAGDLVFVAGPDHASEPMTPFEDLTAKHDADGDGGLTREEVDGTGYFNHFGFLDVDADDRLTPADWAVLATTMASEGWGVLAVRLPVADGAPEIVWNHQQNVPYIPTPLALDGTLYTVEDGIVTSLDPASGEVLHRGRLGQGGTKVYASPVAADGKIYFGTLDGEVVVVQAGRPWKVVAVNALEDPIYASPVIDDGLLLVRTRSRLYGFATATDPAVPAGQETGRR